MSTGGVPDGWIESPLVDAVAGDAPIGYGIVQPGPHVVDGVPMIAVRDLLDVVPERLHRASQSIESAYSRSRIRPGDVLISVKGTTGRIGIVPPRVTGNISRDVARIRLAQEHIPEFWLQLLRSEAAQRTLQQAGVGTTRKELSIGTLRQLTFLHPSRPVQRAIADVLTDADRLIRALARLADKKRDLKQGMMQELLVGRTRLPGFEGAWSTEKLGALLGYEQPSPYLVSSTEYSATGDVPVLTAGKTFVLGYTTETHGIYRALPVIIFDDFTTASKYVTFPFKAKSSAMKMLTAKAEVNLRFVYERMNLIDFPIADHKRRWIAEFSKLEVATPGFAEQKAIAGVIADVDDEIDALERRLESARAIKTAMMQELLTGRTRLPVEVP